MVEKYHNIELNIDAGTHGRGENGGGCGQEDPRHSQVPRPEERPPQAGRRGEELREAGSSLRGRGEGDQGGSGGSGDAEEGRGVRRQYGRPEQHEGMDHGGSD